MPLININWNPNRKELRTFGGIALAASMIVSLLLCIFKGLGVRWGFIIFAIGFIIFLSSMISAKLTVIIYRGLMLLTMPIGWSVSFIVMAAFYFLLLVPLGLFFRLIGRDALQRRFDYTAKSYWVPHCQPDKLDRYFHQF